MFLRATGASEQNKGFVEAKGTTEPVGPKFPSESRATVHALAPVRAPDAKSSRAGDRLGADAPRASE